MTIDTAPITAEQFFRTATGKHCELIEGRIVMMSPGGGQHSRIAFKIAHFLEDHVEEQPLGWVLTDPGVKIRRAPDTVRAPDAAFVAADRLPDGPPRGFLEVVPDLVVEVVSPSDSEAEVRKKVDDWLRAGARLAWVAWPATRSVTVHATGRPERVLAATDTLDGEDVVPGFSCRVADLFA